MIARVVRSRPRRPASWYPVGSRLVLRDGRVFRVATEPRRVWVDPSLGCGGGEWRIVESPRFWQEVSL